LHKVPRLTFTLDCLDPETLCQLAERLTNDHHWVSGEGSQIVCGPLEVRYP
jgi:hypothetical protein